MSRGAANAVLLELGQRMGMPGLCLDDAGACQLVFDQRWLVTIVHAAATGGLSLNCPISAPGIPEGLVAGTLLAMLQGNFMGMGCGGGKLSVAPDRRAYLQLDIAMAEANASLLQNALELLLNHAEVWSNRLNESPAGRSTYAPAAAVPSKSGERRVPDWSMQRV